MIRYTFAPFHILGEMPKHTEKLNIIDQRSMNGPQSLTRKQGIWSNSNVILSFNLFNALYSYGFAVVNKKIVPSFVKIANNNARKIRLESNFILNQIMLEVTPALAVTRRNFFSVCKSKLCAYFTLTNPRKKVSIVDIHKINVFCTSMRFVQVLKPSDILTSIKSYIIMESIFLTRRRLT